MQSLLGQPPVPSLCVPKKSVPSRHLAVAVDLEVDHVALVQLLEVVVQLHTLTLAEGDGAIVG